MPRQEHSDPEEVPNVTYIRMNDEMDHGYVNSKHSNTNHRLKSATTNENGGIQLVNVSTLPDETNHSPLITLTFVKLSKFLKIQNSNVKKGWTKKALLNGVTGEVTPGQVMALMGSSGCGKTTLLNTLSGRGLSGVSGQVLLNGVLFCKSMKRKLAYVLQEDLFFEKLTVREHLTYTALLRLPDHYTKSEKLDKVVGIIRTLGLEKCENTEISLVSGGEKKRINIASELLTGPNLIFLDEPTSGLDSTAAAALITTLKNLASSGKTIITSIHQPSSQIFQSFDQLLLLADGATIFYGKPSNILPYFSVLGYEAPPQYNPADYIMDLINSDPEVKKKLRNEYKANKTSAKSLGYKYLVREPAITNEMILHGSGTQSRIQSADDQLDLGKKWPTGFKDQLSVLFIRSVKLSVKDQLTVLNIIQALFIAFITGLCWFRLPMTESSIPDRSSYVFFVMVFWPSQTLFSGLMSFPSERSIIAKERASGSFRLSAYFIAKSLSEAPMKLVLPTAFLIISYWMANINPFFPTFLAFIGLELLAILVAESIGLTIGASVKNLQQAMVIAMVSLLSFMLVGGFFIRSLPYWLSVWIKWLSFFKYAFDACQRLEFSGDYSYLCENGTYIELCREPNTLVFYGEDALKYLQVDLSTGENVLVLLGMLAFFRIMAYLALRFVKNNDGRT